MPLVPMVSKVSSTQSIVSNMRFERFLPVLTTSTVLKRELETTMALLGANDLSSLGTSFLNTTKLGRDIEDLVCKL